MGKERLDSAKRSCSDVSGATGVYSRDASASAAAPSAVAFDEVRKDGSPS
jgi:hypothetical protein